MSFPFAARACADYTIRRIPQRITLAAFASALGLSSFTLFAAEAPLTLAEMEQQAVARSRQLSAHDMAMAASCEIREELT